MLQESTNHPQKDYRLLSKTGERARAREDGGQFYYTIQQRTPLKKTKTLSEFEEK